jgi:hypothetical protein
MAGTPKMQEHFSAGAWIVRQPENEGHFRWADMPKCRSIFRRVPGSHDNLKTKDISVEPYAGNAGAISGGCLDRTTA